MPVQRDDDSWLAQCIGCCSQGPNELFNYAGEDASQSKGKVDESKLPVQQVMERVNSRPPSVEQPKEGRPKEGANTASGGGSCCCGPLPKELEGMASLDEAHAVRYATWCCYLCCGGCGSSQISSPCFVECKCCLCSEVCKNAGPCVDGDGVCSCIQKTCCTTFACQVPRRPGAPACVICGIECCQGLLFSRAQTVANDHEVGARPSMTEGGIHPHDTLADRCLPCYCCLGGCAISPPDLEQFCSYKTTCCCCHHTGGTMTPACSEESWHYGWIGTYIALGQLYGQCKVPFLCSDSPIIACCGWKCRNRAA